jgi:hypothetical protein
MSQTVNMVGMAVGYQDGVEVTRGQPDPLKKGFQIPLPDAAVN